MKLDSSISAVITGGASGLGAATARLLASHGVKVGLFDLNEELGEKLARELGGVFCKVNVTSTPEVDAAFAKSRAAIGQERNLIGTFRCITKSASGMLKLPVLPDGDRGCIINTASVAAEDGQIGQAAYTASKAGVVGLNLVVARDLAQEGIRSNTILPGIFDTPLLAGAPEHVRAALGASVPFPKRLGVPDEYAQLALTMITNGYFNGECVCLDGAIRMAPR